MMIGEMSKGKDWLDNSALSLFKTCPRKYFLRIEQSIAQSGVSAALSTGGACHDSKAVYLKAKLKGYSHEDCKAVGLLKLSQEMLKITNPDDIRNDTVITRVMDSYFERWRDEPYTTLEVEIGFAVDLDAFLWVGRIDAIKFLAAYGILVEETKTTSIVGERWSLRTKPNNQIDGYVSAWYINTGQMPYGAILDIIPIHDESKSRDKKSLAKKQPFRLITVRNEQDVDNWIKNTTEWFNTLVRCKDSGVWPMNTDACAPLVGFTCEFTDVCTVYPTATSVQDMNISSAFVIDKWEPWEISKAKEQQSKFDLEKELKK